MISLTTESAVAWMLTYALHSSILLGGAWCVDRLLGLQPAWRDTLWKAAFVGALLTASAQTLMQSSPTGEAFLLTAETSVATDSDAVAKTAARTAAGVENAAFGLTAPTAPTARLDGAKSSAQQRPSTVGSHGEVGIVERATGVWASLIRGAGLGTLLWLWASVAGALVLRVFASQWRAARAVSGRVTSTDPALREMVDELRTGFDIARPVRLSVLPGLATPVALGRSEVVLPARALSQLSPSELHAALAHELAHLSRFDPIWRIASALLGAVLFIQPLNTLARRRLAEISEAMADAGAVRITGTPIPLARCLTTVAGWMTPASRTPVAAIVPMAADHSELAKRVERVLGGEGIEVQPSRFRTSALVSVVLVVGFLSPRVGAQANGAHAPAQTEPPAEALDPAPEQGSSVDVDSPVAGPTNAAEPELATSRRGAIDTVVAHPEARRNRGTPLSDRFEWAVREGSRRRIGDVWVVYRFPAPPQAGSQWAHKSRWGGSSDGDELTRYLGDVEVGASDGYALVRIKPSRDQSFDIVEVAGQSAQLGDFDFLDHRVYWLGAVPAAQGVALLRRLMPGDYPEVREGLLELIGMHDDPEVVPFLLSVLDSDDEDWLRAEAAESLELYPEPDVTRALERSAMRDRAQVVRIEAAEALGELGNDEARDALIRIIESGPEDAAFEAVESLAAIPGAETTRALASIAREATDARVRREASEHLLEADPGLARDILAGTSGAEASPSLRREAIDAIAGERVRGAQVEANEVEANEVEASQVESNIDLLAEVAFTDPSDDVRREAVEALAVYGAASEVALLRIAFDHPSDRVARQAAETLGKLPANVAVDALVRLTRESDSERVVVQAVESLGEFSGDRVEDILADIADSHRFRSARREARDQLYGP